MNADPRFWAAKRVCVTGGTGFLGWHIVRQLLPLTPFVRVFGLRPNAPRLVEQLEPLDVEYGDIRDPVAVGRALRDCQIVFHTAGNVAVWGPMLRVMRDIHVVGTEQVLRALPTGARLVHTSSVVAVGASAGAEPMTESTRFNLGSLAVDYVHAKRAAEELALAAASQGVDVVAVNPAYLIGPVDYDLSAMGRLCQRVWNGRVPAVASWALNLVDVRDVARGHLLAAEKGTTGERYILGGVNGSLREFVEELVEVAGLPTQWRVPVPAWLQLAFAHVKDLRSRFTGREPYPSVQFARMCLQRWHYSSARAKAELGYEVRSMRESVRDTFRWFAENGMLLAHRGRKPAILTDDATRHAA